MKVPGGDRAPEGVQDLDSLTLVIPTRDRTTSVRRILRQVAGTSAHVLLLNNGSTRIVDQMSDDVPDHLVEIHSPGDFPRQMQSVGLLVDTPLAMNVDDDSTIDVDALVDACRFLLQCGDSTSLASPLGFADYRAGEVKLYGPDWPTCIPRLTSNLLDTPVDRVRFQMARHWRQQGWYALAHVRKYRESMEVAASVIGKVSSLSVAEVLCEYMHAWLGPIICMGRVIQYRSTDESHADYGRWVSFEEWTDSKRYEPELRQVSEMLAALSVGDEWHTQDIEDLLRMSARDSRRARYRRKLTVVTQALRRS